MQSLRWIKYNHILLKRNHAHTYTGQWILAFEYGARTIRLGYAFKWMKFLHPVDMSTFLKDLAPYLPQHLQQTAMKQATTMNNPLLFAQPMNVFQNTMVNNPAFTQQMQLSMSQQQQMLMMQMMMMRNPELAAQQMQSPSAVANNPALMQQQMSMMQSLPVHGTNDAQPAHASSTMPTAGYDMPATCSGLPLHEPFVSYQPMGNNLGYNR
jgi:hypothetical protein